MKNTSRYYVNSYCEWTDGSAFVEIKPNGDSFVISKNGSLRETTLSIHAEDARELVADGRWKEITEKEALDMLNRDRYFVRVQGYFTGGTLFVKVSSNGSSTCETVKGTINTPWNTLEHCLGRVQDGEWKEITEKEAKAMLAVKGVDFSKTIGQAQTLLRSLDTVVMPAYVARKVVEVEESLRLAQAFLKTR